MRQCQFAYFRLASSALGLQRWRLLTRCTSRRPTCEELPRNGQFRWFFCCGGFGFGVLNKSVLVVSNFQQIWSPAIVHPVLFPLSIFTFVRFLINVSVFSPVWLHGVARQGWCSHQAEQSFFLCLATLGTAVVFASLRCVSDQEH